MVAWRGLCGQRYSSLRCAEEEEVERGERDKRSRAYVETGGFVVEVDDWLQRGCIIVTRNLRSGKDLKRKRSLLGLFLGPLQTVVLSRDEAGAPVFLTVKSSSDGTSGRGHRDSFTNCRTSSELARAPRAAGSGEPKQRRCPKTLKLSS